MTPQAKARTAGIFYLLVFITGSFAFVSVKWRLAANVISATLYIIVVLLFYGIFKPVNKAASMLAAFVGLTGCILSVLGSFNLAPFDVNSLAIFGIYCLLIGYLIFNSTFLPRILGLGMVIGGLGWLTFISSPLANQLSPFNMLPGVLGEGALTLWLLIKGVNVDRWKEQAGLTGEQK